MGNLFDKSKNMYRKSQLTNQDNEGQPAPQFNEWRRKDRNAHELIGICRGMISDARLNELEFNYLERWLRLKPESKDEWPANVIYDRIKVICEDGNIDEVELKDMLYLLKEITGMDPDCYEVEGTTRLPLDDPPTAMIFENRRFCFTGRAAYGNRRKCQALTQEKGGQVTDLIASSLDYLVIGHFGSRDWVHTTHGRKIEEAVRLKEQGAKLSIVTELHWYEQLIGPE